MEKLEKVFVRFYDTNGVELPERAEIKMTRSEWENLSEEGHIVYGAPDSPPQAVKVVYIWEPTGGRHEFNG